MVSYLNLSRTQNSPEKGNCLRARPWGYTVCNGCCHSGDFCWFWETEVCRTPVATSQIRGRFLVSRVLISTPPKLRICDCAQCKLRPWMWTDRDLRPAFQIQGQNLPSRGRDPEGAGPALTRTPPPPRLPHPAQKVAIVLCDYAQLLNPKNFRIPPRFPAKGHTGGEPGWNGDVVPGRGVQAAMDYDR